MVFPRRLIGADEHVVAHLRTHAKALAWPALVLILTGGAVGAGVAAVPARYAAVGSAAVVLLGLAVATAWSVLPFLRWRTTTFTLTDRRLLTRQGIVSRAGLDLPLSRVTDVASEQSLTDRLLGCGTLVVHTAADAPPIHLVDVPDVRWVHQALTELVLTDRPVTWDQTTSAPAR